MKKKFMMVFLTMLLVFPYYTGSADPNEDMDENDTQAEIDNGGDPMGKVASKDEVIYGSLHANGSLNEIFVVNMLEVVEAGLIIDHGNYESVKNLTDLTEIEQVDNKVRIQASPGWYYYQGNKKNAELPWNIDISYMLDGEEISAPDLAGKDGRLLITINTSQNESVDPVFYEYYALQVSLTLDTDNTSNLHAPDATIANVGKQRQVNFTVMPERDGDLTLLADVVDFEMEGIDISGIPLSMALEEFEMDEMTREMRKLADAIQEINNGVSDLRDGVSELNDGMWSLSSGSNEYYSGMNEINNSSGELVDASATIRDALRTLNEELSGAQLDFDMSELEQMPEMFERFSEGVGGAAEGLVQFNENFAAAFSALESAINEIPETPDSLQENIEELRDMGVDPEIIDFLIEVNAAAQSVRGTFSEVREVFGAVESTLEGINETVGEMTGRLDTISEEVLAAFENMDELDAFDELIDGVAMLAENYGEFHNGLRSYTNGVSQLTGAYGEIDSGISEIANGTSELESGVGELHDGTEELASETSDLPEQMEEEMEAMLEEFERSDFEAVSYVSDANKNINTVQFVLKTEPIEIVSADDEGEEEEEQPSFWERLWGLFS
ncbi:MULTISPECIES: WXG100 family type VII secretion target [Bacillaceae]|uniref:WXG100 family type VII secretion target n=1 Tax=Bacillaceae TaxID=186817 RepID=UPI001F3514A4|nr:YhgE/Pip domain-containing protein [Litchfieldia alkalitelluris]